MRINLTSVYVDDQRAALAFYVDVPGFTKHRDIPLGEDSWLTVVSPEAPQGPELLLEPAGHPAVKPYRDALAKDGIPLAQFAVDDVAADSEPVMTGVSQGFRHLKLVCGAVVSAWHRSVGRRIESGHAY